MLLYPAHSGTHDSSELVFANFFSTKKQDREKEKLRMRSKREQLFEKQRSRKDVDFVFEEVCQRSNYHERKTRTKHYSTCEAKISLV